MCIMFVEGIYGFNREYSFLSNFYPSTVIYDNIEYPTVEHAYQAAKTKDFTQRNAIRNLPYPALAKKAGRRVNIRQDWDNIKISVMENLLRQKFQHPILKQKLLQTGDMYIEETNTWKDTFWGVYNGKGKNVLGNLLMKIRADQRLG